ncbi:MAG: hypothetical protein QM809_03280 [Gordonia sp. (in: high G+C Gram-positive bacteria)]|uniref:hypothetical protein n=1 Tax=Gordonia sp. (in: high G+C Gram-positive bacteria) TaxID=84139 RepID=UPI0039E6615E
MLGKIGVPQPRDLAMYGVLAGLAAVGILEWPAAIGLAIGVTVAEQGFNNLRHQNSTSGSAAAPRHGGSEPRRRSDEPGDTDRPAVTVDGEVLASRPAPTAKRAARGPSARPHPARRRRR